MADRIEFKISGVPQLVKRMRSLPDKLQKRGLKKAVKAGAEKIADAARVNAMMIDDPATAENIAANIAAQYASKMSKANVAVAYRVGVLGGAKGRERVDATARALSGNALPGGETFHWRYLEFGTSKMAARPFMRPAMYSHAEYAAEEVATELEKILDRVVKEL